MAKRTATWRVLLWAGVIASVLAWTWAWYLGRGASVIPLLFALCAVALAFRARAGYSWALVALLVAGFAMLLASLYWMMLLYTASAGPSVADVFSAAVVPFVAAMVLLTGAAAGLVHRRES
jgi:hypothetical protein